MSTTIFSNLNSAQRITTPQSAVGVSFFTPTQAAFRAKQQGYLATPTTGAHAPVRRLRKHPTGAASMESLEPDTTLYRSVLGDWGRPTRAGRR